MSLGLCIKAPTRSGCYDFINGLLASSNRERQQQQLLQCFLGMRRRVRAGAVGSA